MNKKHIALFVLFVLLLSLIVSPLNVFAEEEGVDPCGCGGYYGWTRVSSHHYSLNNSGYCTKCEFVERYICSKCKYYTNERLAVVPNGCGIKL
ncbi:MAG: hypothetical protein FWG30_08280 [Eubacteriaceae bacterium]|nr:hypothetical protein [Eubacteriaceae bacterium]